MEEREIHLRDYLKVIDKRRYTVYTVFILVFIIVLIGTLSSTPIYKATTKVLIEKGPPADLMRNYYYIPYDPEFYETQYQLIKSRSVARKVVEKLKLGSRPNQWLAEKEGDSPITGIIGWFRDLAGVITKIAGGQSDDREKAEREEVSPEEREEQLAAMISGGINVTPLKNSRIVNISFTSPNPEFASLVANTVAQAYIDQVLEMKMSATRHTLEWMTKKAEEERKKLEKSERALQEYMRANDIVTMENRVAVIPQKLTELSSELVKAETRRKELEDLYLKIKSLRKDLKDAETIPAISEDPSLQSIRDQILKAEQKIMELSKKYGRKHPKMIKAVDDLNVLRKKRLEEIRRVISSIRNEYDLARSKEESLRSLLKRTKDEALNLNEKFIQYEVLKREVDSNKQLYDALVRKIKEASVTEQIKAVNVWIVEKAETPKAPFKPRKMLNILLGIIVGLFGGVGLAFFVEYLDNTIKSPEEAENRLDIPVLGIVSLWSDKESSIETICLREPKSTLAEEYRAIRTGIILSSPDHPPRSLLVTSVGPEDGKTVTATNLAISLAQSEYSVIIVDADLRKPRVHKVFGLQNGKGLSTYLAGASDMDIIQEGPLSNLRVITAGPVPPNPAELLSSQRMKDLIMRLTDKYDIMILDSSPILSVADGLILGSLTEGTILVVRAAKTTYEEARRCLKSLQDLKADVKGLIINVLDLKKRDYYYYRYHQYYYTDEDEENLNVT